MAIPSSREASASATFGTLHRRENGRKAFFQQSDPDARSARRSSARSPEEGCGYFLPPPAAVFAMPFALQGRATHSVQTRTAALPNPTATLPWPPRSPSASRGSGADTTKDRTAATLTPSQPAPLRLVSCSIQRQAQVELPCSRWFCAPSSGMPVMGIEATAIATAEAECPGNNPKGDGAGRRASPRPSAARSAVTMESTVGRCRSCASRIPTTSSSRETFAAHRIPRSQKQDRSCRRGRLQRRHTARPASRGHHKVQEPRTPPGRLGRG